MLTFPLPTETVAAPPARIAGPSIEDMAGHSGWLEAWLAGLSGEVLESESPRPLAEVAIRPPATNFPLPPVEDSIAEEPEDTAVPEDRELTLSPVALGEIVLLGNVAAVPVAVPDTDRASERLAPSPAAFPQAQTPALPIAADRGELIWSAELQIQPGAETAFGAAGSDPSSPPVEKSSVPALPPAALLSPADAGESLLAAEPSKTIGSGPPLERNDTGERQSGESRDETPEPETHSHAQHGRPAEIFAHSLDAGWQAAHATPRTERDIAPAPRLVAEHSPQVWKTSRVATVQLDLGGEGAADGTAPLRLVISQRGEQVNVRVRAWESSAAPLAPERMQPLLDSLAEKGFVARSEPHTARPLTACRFDAPLADQPISIEAYAAAPEQESFPGSNGERQQQQQERRQQQQALVRQRNRASGSRGFLLPNQEHTDESSSN